LKEIKKGAITGRSKQNPHEKIKRKTKRGIEENVLEYTQNGKEVTLSREAESERGIGEH